jgi:hypothetical protein
MNVNFIVEIAPIVFGGFAMFCAIMLWPRSSSPSWNLVILSVIFGYAGIVINVLTRLGLVQLNTGHLWLDTALLVLSGNGSYLFVAFALLKAYSEHGRYKP